MQLYFRLRADGAHPTTQKVLLGFISVAAFMRGLYFSLEESVPSEISNQLFLSYYPFLIMSGALLVMSWAEVYHLGVDKSATFLVESRKAFYIFVGFSLAVEVIKWAMLGLGMSDIVDQFYYGYLVLVTMLVSLTVIVYGVEMFFKHVNNTVVSAERETVKFLSRVGISVLGLLQVSLLTMLTLGFIAKLKGERLENFEELLSRTIELCLVVW